MHEWHPWVGHGLCGGFDHVVVPTIVGYARAPRTPMVSHRCFTTGSNMYRQTALAFSLMRSFHFLFLLHTCS